MRPRLSQPKSWRGVVLPAAMLGLLSLVGCGDSVAPPAAVNLGGKWSGSAQGLTLALSLASTQCPVGCGGSVAGQWSFATNNETGTLSSGNYDLATFQPLPAHLGMWLSDLENTVCFTFQGQVVDPNTISGTLGEGCATDLAVAKYQAAFTLVRQ